MNNTDFFNDNRAEALKLIAEHVHKGQIASLHEQHNDVNYQVYVCNNWYNPCATTTEGKAQADDLAKAYRKELLKPPMTHNKLSPVIKYYGATETKEKLCIAMLDLIRKE